jgi:hypothetical protein
LSQKKTSLFSYVQGYREFAYSSTLVGLERGIKLSSQPKLLKNSILHDHLGSFSYNVHASGAFEDCFVCEGLQVFNAFIRFCNLPSCSF